MLSLAPHRSFALSSLLLACSSSPSTGTTTAKAEPAKAEPAAPAHLDEGPLPTALRAKICAAEHVDESSQIFLAINKAGKVVRVVVTPSRTIADMGNLVFDMGGALLGHETGSEFPWDDEALADQERVRVAALMGGAVVPNAAKPLSCS